MRLLPVALSFAIAAATMASAGQGQSAEVRLDPRSITLTQQGQALSASGRHNEAVDMFETALAVDPRNRVAFIGLARVAQAQKLPGKAVRLYAQALQIQANDVDALAGQGEALVQRGAVDRARKNLERVRALCSNACTQATTLAAAIERGPPPEILTAQRPEPAATPAAQPQTPRRD